jgi:7,8-dihydropterin-6-yl-methyl-4-(beta-D-ribofuranosyl)aminobenzene 5'-phosphate synthase
MTPSSARQILGGMRGLAQVRLLVLNDNEPGPGLRNEWGWSILVEPTNGKIALFDADTTPHTIEANSKILGVDLSLLSFAVLSHEHHDHYGGFSYVARKKPGLEVYAPPGLHLWAKKLRLKLIINKSGMKINETYLLTPPLRAGFGLMEHALAVRTGSGENAVVIVGCSHPGVERLVEAAIDAFGIKPVLTIGGFHGPSKHQLDRLAELSKHIAPAHCSGREAFEYVRAEYPSQLVLVRTGSELVVSGDKVEVVRY